MKLITTRDRILSVSKRWKQQYAYDRDGVQPKLDRLDLSTATAERIKSIIGNSSWTDLRCDECYEIVDQLIEVGEHPNCDSSTACICKSCATKALSLFSKDES